MEITNLLVEGFANIEQVELNLGKINALVALNNYGKSNVINAISFGIDFISMPTKHQANMMAIKDLIPINNRIANKPYKFQVTFISNVSGEEQVIEYSYSFDWIKDKKEKGQRIIEEFLKVKSNKPDAKFKTYIHRNLSESLYLPSQTGRRDKPLKVDKSELAINKLNHFDELFYNKIIHQINKLSIENIDTMEDPDKLFRRVYGSRDSKILRPEYSLNMPASYDVGFFIYSLKVKKPEMYELFKDSVKSLLVGIEDFEAVEIDFKNIARFASEKKKDLPVNFPDKLYDIRVKEYFNNQQTDIDGLSSGSQKLFFVLALTIAAEINKVPIITFEELENSIHPGLLQKLLIIIDGLVVNTKVLLTSHSPYLIQYLDIDRVKIGMPNKDGLAVFKEIKKSRFNKVLSIAEEEGVSVGDLIFDKMLEGFSGDSDLLNELCE